MAYDEYLAWVVSEILALMPNGVLMPNAGGTGVANPDACTMTVPSAATVSTSVVPPTVFQKTGGLLVLPKLWAGSATTTSGIATFNPTDDGTAGGNALFTTIHAAVATAHTNTGSITSMPIASVKLVSADRKSVTINAVTGATLVTLGATVSIANDGTPIHLLVIGV